MEFINQAFMQRFETGHSFLPKNNKNTLLKILKYQIVGKHF